MEAEFIGKLFEYGLLGVMFALLGWYTRGLQRRHDTVQEARVKDAKDEGKVTRELVGDLLTALNKLTVALQKRGHNTNGGG